MAGICPTAERRETHVAAPYGVFEMLAAEGNNRTVKVDDTTLSFPQTAIW